MESTSQGSLRASVESALTQRLQVIGDHLQADRVSGTSTTLIDEYIADDVEYLRGLLPSYWRHLNRLRSPLLRLPPELLSKILYTATIDVRLRLIKWLYLGHICRDLRSTLLEMHSLWAGVVYDAQFAHVQEELLRRAGDCPIFIHLDSTAPLPLLDSVPKLLDRARTIYIVDIPLDRMRMIAEVLRYSQFKDLERLTLVMFSDGADALRENPLVPFDQPDLVVPKLHTLHLVGMFFPVNMSSLTSLSLTWTNAWPAPIQNGRAFADMLRRCERLKDLALWGWIPDYDELDALRCREYTISFPELARLNLSQGMKEILAFWAILSIPESATIRLDTGQDMYDFRGLLAHARSLRTFIAQTQVAGVSKISQIGISKDNILTLELGYTAELPMHHIPARDPWDSLQPPTFAISMWSSIKETEEFVSFLECICATFELRMDSIATLKIAWNTAALVFDEESADSRRLYTMFPSVTALEVKYSAVDVGPLLGSSSPAGFNYFPKLQTLRLYRGFSEVDVKSLLEIVIKRADHGTPLQSIGLKGGVRRAGFEAEFDQFLKQLEAIVPRVRFIASE